MNSFSESQRFRQWWLIALMIISIIGILYALIQQLYFKIPFGDKPTSDGVLIFLSIFLIIIWIFVFSIRLDIYISTSCIKYRMFPFHCKFKTIDWSNVQSIYVRKYKPLLEYGGWGFRGFSSNRALNISGNIGIQIVFKDNKKLLLGTKKEHEAKSVINEFFKEIN